MTPRLILAATFLFAAPFARAVDIAIETKFPGGNALVQKMEADAVHLLPDLRGGQPWFYWCFDAVVAEPARVTFVFGGTQKIGVRGPAFSTDGGRTWDWLGADKVTFGQSDERFWFEFKSPKQRVRFAVAIPYLQADLDAFEKAHVTNPHLVKSELALTQKGTPVDLLQIGKPGPGVRAMLVTARHHACESTASYVLEGFMNEALSDSPAAVEFRKRYVLFAVPLVDTDGVQAGDQGKNRAPHDHNRDYGPEPLYPEIRAIQELAAARDVRFAVDFHCPALRGDVHEAFHFLGLGLPHVRDNLNEWIEWIREERPQEVMAPLNLLVDSKKPNAIDRRINSHYMATRENALMAATLEVPYTQVRPALGPEMARAYGAGLLRAWVRTAFVSAAAAAETRGVAGYAGLAEFRSAFLKTYRAKPQDAEALAVAYRKDDAPAVYRVEAANLLGTLRLYQKRFDDARSLSQAACDDSGATARQRATGVLQKVQATCADPESNAKEVEAALAEALRLPYAAPDHRARAYDAAADFYRRTASHARAIELTRMQLTVATPYERGRLLIRIAADHDALHQPAEALAARQEAVKTLRAMLEPMPGSVFGAMMAADLFDALQSIPQTPLAELRAAGQMVLDHKVSQPLVKDRVRKALAAREKE